MTAVIDSAGTDVRTPNCALILGTERIAAVIGVRVEGPHGAPIALTGAGTLAAPGEAGLVCASSQQVFIENLSMTAIRVGEVEDQSPRATE